MLRSRNLFLTPQRFIALSAWIEHGGVWVLLPGVWVEWDVEIGSEARVTRWGFGIGKWRAGLDWGLYQAKSPRRVLDWKKDGLDDFLSWSKKIFNQTWSRNELETMLREEPHWYRLIALGGPPSYYTRVLLAREMIKRQRENQE